MSQPSRSEREAARVAGEVTRRAIRRLDILEWVTFCAAIAVAVIGGWAVAWLLARPGGEAFALIWTVASLFLFVVPGGIVILKNRRDERRSALEPDTRRTHDNG